MQEKQNKCSAYRVITGNAYSANILHVPWRKDDMNAGPWSVIRVEPVPCRVTICVAYTLAHVTRVCLRSVGM